MVSHPEVTGRKGGVTANLPRTALSIREFCHSVGISEFTYFKLKRLGQGPKEMVVGARRLISVESAEAWRRQREQAQA